MDSVRGQKILNIFTFLLCHTFTTGLDTVCPARKHLYTNCTNPCLAGEGTVFCHSDLTTRCQPDYCGGCIARFFNDVGQEVHCTAEYGFICELKSHIIGCHDQPGKVLHVTYANYGRTSTVVCVHPYGLERLHNTTTCRSPSSLSVVRGWCEGQTQCTITAANELFGEDPCFGIYKYLEVEVECVLPGTMKKGFFKSNWFEIYHRITLE